MSAPHATGPTAMTSEQVIALLRLDPASFIADLVRSHGDVVELPVGSRRLFVLSNPAYIHDLFARSDIFKKRPDEAAEASYLAQINGFTPMFAEPLMRGYADTMMEAVGRADARWQQAVEAEGVVEVDIYRELMRITLEIVAKTLFHVDLRRESAELAAALLDLDFGYGFDPLEANLGHLMPHAPHPRLLGHEAARELLRGSMRALFEREAQSAEPSPLIGALLQHVSREHAISIAVGTMISMHEVTVTTLAWTWYLLSQYPHVEAALRDEWSRVLDGRPPGYADLPRLVYTERVLAETRRLYPSVWMILRFVREDTSFGEYTVPADSVVMASAQMMHRDPRFFPEPYRFDPSRFTHEGSAGRPSGAYFPFSDGARACAGETFAKMQDTLLLTALAQNWRARLVPGQQFQPRVQKSNAPRPGIRMLLHREGDPVVHPHVAQPLAAPVAHDWPKVHR